MNHHLALNPHHSVIVEACAGSGKTWLLVSRMVRLLLDGVKPSEILAITFTRKAAQEMQARLHEWLHVLAVADEAVVCDFLQQRGLDALDAVQLQRARGLYREFLLAQGGITLNTFHGWFMQVMQRAPLNAGVPIGMTLLERTSALREEAWDELADALQAAPDGVLAVAMQDLLRVYGLHSTKKLLENFLAKRTEWWAYTQGQSDALGWAVQQLREQLQVDESMDSVADGMADVAMQQAVYDFARALATGTEVQCEQANRLQIAWETEAVNARFAALQRVLYTQKNEPKVFKHSKKQDEASFVQAREVLFAKLQVLRDALTEREVLRLNQAGLRCGAALLAHYQRIKLRQQQIDFADVEWQVAQLLNQSDFAEYMQYKLDSRYRHVLLDEFQDTNPLQWQILQAWFAASAAVDSRPTVFVVGDPKQSIYRFRRADARLFGEVREFLQNQFDAQYLRNNQTRRNAPAVLALVNQVFATKPEGFEFETHEAHQTELAGYVEVLPLAVDSEAAAPDQPLPPGRGGDDQTVYEHGMDIEDEGTSLRNPLTTPRAEKSGSEREAEAAQFAAKLLEIVTTWNVLDAYGKARRAEYGDIMVLVRKRTHLRVYEAALRAQHIPFFSSRRGGLLDTLEAEDVQALLTFLITPFADLPLAQVLRSPIFSCADEDLILLAQGEATWWQRLQAAAQSSAASPALQRAHLLLHDWLQRADKLPVHDLLDHIYFSGDVLHRYAATVPDTLRATVLANLQAFMDMALNVDAGRYPSLPRFLSELRDLRAASDNESPDEGKVGEVGNAVRIYTVHEAKGLESPIVWLLDANDTRSQNDGYNVLLDWSPSAAKPHHFSLYSIQAAQGAQRQPLFEAEENYAKRENMNLLYVALTRAKQGVLVSGNGKLKENSWYGRVTAATSSAPNPLLDAAASVVVGQQVAPSMAGDATTLGALQRPLNVGSRAVRSSHAQRMGTWLHALLQHLAPPQPVRDVAALQARCNVPAEVFATLVQQAQQLLSLPHLQRFFDAAQYLHAHNEIGYVDAQGELKRIDRLVEFTHEVWVLDYKLSHNPDPTPYRAQMHSYRHAMQSVYPHKTVRCALIFVGGEWCEVT